ncbi:MAG: Amuc_1100 family pilus-like protein [Kiritimatiellales bacterium]|nr:Amuc_1100 family pilus-like protein [Kiritimatiellales bacterium]
MMNVRNNRVLFIGGGICAVLLLVSVVFLVRGYTGFQKQSRILDRQYRRLHELNTRQPFPSEANVNQMEENLERLEYRIGELAAQLMRDPFPPDAVDAAGFSARAQEVIERIGKQAVQFGVGLPVSLEAGFGRYASGGAVPEQRHVSRLSLQLYSVEKVADVLVRSGVHSIEALTRDNFETEVDADEPSDNRRRRAFHAEPESAPSARACAEASAVQPDGLYCVERIGAVFTAREDDVWRVLDQLAAAPHFMVVAEFAHTTQSDILAYNPDKVKLGQVGDDATLKFLSDGILSGKTALSRPERIIAGNEMIRVSIAVDVYNFEPEGKRESAQ